MNNLARPPRAGDTPVIRREGAENTHLFRRKTKIVSHCPRSQIVELAGKGVEFRVSNRDERVPQRSPTGCR
jgi:hypothetical protein